MNWELIWLVIPAIVIITMCYRWRGFRVFVVILAGLALFLFPVVYRAVTSLANVNTETSIINNYALDYRLGPSGDLQLVETLDVEFTEMRRGIFRFFDEVDAADDSVRHPVQVISVERCSPSGKPKCQPEPYTTYYEDGFLVAKIGRANKVYFAGTVNQYKITSTAGGAITTLPDSSDYQWYWDVIGAGWDMPIDKAQIVAHLPTTPTSVGCITDSGECPVTSSRDLTYTTDLGPLSPRTPVTWKAVFPPSGLTPTPTEGAIPWWQSPIALTVGVLAALGLFALIWYLRERPPDETPMFAAPGNDILPMVWTWKENPAEEPFQTVLLQLSQLGVVQLLVEPEGQQQDRDPEWVQIMRTGVAVPPDVAGAAELLDKLDLAREGDSILIQPDSIEVGKKLQGLTAELGGLSSQAAQAQGYYTRSGLGVLVHLTAALLAPVSLLVLIWTKSPFFASMFLIPAIAGLWSSKELGTRLSASGMTMRDQVSGLRVALSTPASVERFDYALKVRYFTQFLPWAVALGCAEKWAEACRPPEGAEVESSAYFAASSTYHASQAVSTAVASASAGAVAAYAATQSSSSSGGGGGGFSSGGGSGGGGGGSW